MLMKTVYELVAQTGNAGIKCAKIATTLKVPTATASGILSILKKQGKVTNKDAIWHLVTDTANVCKIKVHLMDISALNDARWAHGYISALADFDCIEEREFDTLIAWLEKTKQT